MSLQHLYSHKVDGSLLMPLKLPRLLKRSSPQIIEDKITHTVEIPVKLPVRLPVKPPVELPVELWYHIASMLKGKPDLSRLYRTNHTLRAICQQYLYCSITIYIGEYSKPICSLLRAMRNRRLADLVTSLCVSIAGVDHPHRQELCNRVDDLAGRLVVPLRNLWNLTYYCNMCCEHSDNHHLYMQRLETKVLTKLELSGQCFYKHQCPTLQILSSPCIRGITSLDLDYATRWNLEPAEQALIEGDSFLPCLRELSSPTFRLFTSRLRKGSITNIYSRSNHSDLFTLLSNSLPGVMYLYQQHIEALIPSVMDNPSPYLKLKTMSSFVFRNISDVSTRSSDYAHFDDPNSQGKS